MFRDCNKLIAYYMDNIFSTIREERQDFLNNEIEVVPGYTFSQYETVKKIHLYFNSHYVDGDYEEVNGVTRKKIFKNISNWRCEVATKMLDIDVKDFTLIGNDEEQDLNVLLLEKELKVWLKKHELGRKLNQIVEELPIYGTVVIEKVKDGVELVDLRYLYNDQGADSLENGRYTDIKSYMSCGDLRKMKGKWENVDDAIESFGRKQEPGYDTAGGSNSGSQQNATPEGAPLVEVWKRYGEVPLSWFTEKESDADEYVLAKYIVAGVDACEKNDKGVILEEHGIVLYKEQLDELPLKEVHFTRTKGRWLGIGIVEKIFEEQRRTNEIQNQKARAMEIAALILLQCQDKTVTENVTTDTENGQILHAKSPITGVPTEARDLVAFDNEEQALDQQSDRQTFSYDAIRGERAPASATLGSIQNQTEQATSAFDYKRENIGIFIGEYIKDIVFPQLAKDLNKEHILRYTGSSGELKKIREKFAKRWALDEQVRMMLNHQAPVPFEILMKKAMDELTQSGDKVWIDVMKNFFKDLDFEVDLVTTGENRNVFAQLQNAQTVLQIVASDPTILQDPVKRKILFKVLSNMGMHTSELEDMENEIAQGNIPSPIQAQQMPNGAFQVPTNTQPQ